jgi:hypothetical protein
MEKNLIKCFFFNIPEMEMEKKYELEQINEIFVDFFIYNKIHVFYTKTQHQML